MKQNIMLLLLAVILLLSLTVSAASPENYTMTYVNTDGNQRITSIQKYYCLDRNKLRVETIRDDKLVMIDLLREDKKTWYIIYPDIKAFSLQIAEPGQREALSVGAPISKLGKKIGGTELLGLTCDIYENKAEKSSCWSLVARDYGICLKQINKKNGKVVSQTEAKEFSLDKPDASLFELPSGLIASVQYGD